MKILLQFPEGLKQYALSYAKDLEAKGNEIIISASPSFGACDVAIEEAKKVGAGKIVHFGHAEFIPIKEEGIEIEYVPYYINVDLSILGNSLQYLQDFKKIGIVTTVQHIKQLSEVKSFYEKNGKEVLIGKPYSFAKFNGQILGCDVGSAATIDKEVEAFVYFGGGLFHPLGAVYATTKPFLGIDPFAGKIEWLDSYRAQYESKKRARITMSLEAKNFGILLSTKVGQYNMNLADILKKKAAEAGINAYILTASTFDFDSLNNMMEIDAFVNTACPRLVTEDAERIRKPLISADEFIEVLNIRKANKK